MTKLPVTEHAPWPLHAESLQEEHMLLSDAPSWAVVVCAGHCVHSELPAVEENEPSEQGVQTWLVVSGGRW